MDNKLESTFHDQVVLPTFTKQIKQLDEDYHRNKSRYQEGLAKHIEEFLLACSDKEVTYFHLSWLRSSFFIFKKREYILEAYSDEWYGDSKKVETIIDFDWIYQYIQSFYDKIEVKRQQNFPLLSVVITEKMVNRYFGAFQAYFKAIIPKSLLKEMIVRVGEYHGESEPVSIIGIKQRATLEQIKERPESFMHHEMHGLSANGEQHRKSNFVHMTFQKAELLDCDFQKSILIGTSFKNSQLSGVNFSYSYLQDSQFENCVCQNCDFRFAHGSLAPANELLPSYFGVNFHGADLRGSDFRFAHLKGVDFTDANLEGAMFMESQRNELNLSAKQQAKIRWLAE